ncbi:hypothetical protein CF165_33605 [Amycolatopsis vastitatis]|uniref:SH3b domain-containing protein n=1 Tax=Amycolatopsis vastitatis TaxID=1905142 RepID=A0A229SUA7_9PSEU|nr:hypothetical protein CF165_33605 [Amycolatopsis vastitatis]
MTANGTPQFPAPTAAAPPSVAADGAADGAADIGGKFIDDGIRVHAEPGTTSATKGLAYRSHTATVHCVVPRTGSDPYAYFSLTDNATGVTGYVAEPYVAPDRKVRTC